MTLVPSQFNSYHDDLLKNWTFRGTTTWEDSILFFTFPRRLAASANSATSTILDQVKYIRFIEIYNGIDVEIWFYNLSLNMSDLRLEH